MARITTDLLFAVTTQTLSYRTMEGRPTSATYKAFFDFNIDDATPQFSGSCTIDAPTTTVSAPSGPSQADAQKINLTLTTGILVGRKYLLSEGAKQEWVDPIEVTASYVRVRHPLASDYTIAATFQSTTIFGAVDDTWAADRTKLSDARDFMNPAYAGQPDPNPRYRARYDITVAGVVYIHYSYFDLVRAPMVPQVDLGDLNERAPGLVDSLPPEYRVDQGRPLIDAAWRSVRARFVAMNIRPDAIREDEVLDEMVILRAIAMVATSGVYRPMNWASQGEYAAKVDNDYNRFVEQHFEIQIKHKLAIGTGGGADRIPVQPIWQK